MSKVNIILGYKVAVHPKTRVMGFDYESEPSDQKRNCERLIREIKKHCVIYKN